MSSGFFLRCLLPESASHRSDPDVLYALQHTERSPAYSSAFSKPGAVAQDSRHRVATRREPSLTEHLLQLWLGSLSWLLLQLDNLGKDFSILFFYLFSKFQIISNSKRQTAQKGKSNLACEGGERVCPAKCSQHTRAHTRSQRRGRQRKGK